MCVIDKLQAHHAVLPYVGLEDIESGSAVFVGSRQPRAVKSSTFRFAPRHVLYGRLRPYLNKVLTPDFEGHCSTEIFPLLPGRELLRDFLKYWLLEPDVAKGINATSTGARMPRANMNAVLGFEIALPSVSEQKALVTKLETTLLKCQTLSDHTTARVAEAASVLQAERDTVFNAHSEGGVCVSLGDMAAFKNGVNFTSASKGDSVLIVGVKDFQDSFLAPMDGLDEVTIDGKVSDDELLREDDLLIVRSNGNQELIGRCLLVKDVPHRAVHSGFTIRVRLTDRRVIPEYLAHFLKSTSARASLVSGGSGTNIKSLNQGTLAGLSVPVPPLVEQKKVVQKLTAIADRATALCDVYRTQLAELGTMRASLVHHAVNGDL